MKKMKKITTLDDLAKDGKIDIDTIVEEAEKKKAEQDKKKEKKSTKKANESKVENESEIKTEL